jgi:hypothetical protein
LKKVTSFIEHKNRGYIISKGYLEFSGKTVMIRAPGGRSAPLVDAEDESRLSNKAVAVNTISFGILCLAIYIAPHILEQFGVEVLK